VDYVKRGQIELLMQLMQSCGLETADMNSFLQCRAAYSDVDNVC